MYSPEMLSHATDVVLEEVREWQSRPIENLYMRVYLDATSALFPNAQTQLCIVHLILNSLAIGSLKDRRVIVQDLKTIYKAVTAKEVEAALGDFETKGKT